MFKIRDAAKFLNLPTVEIHKKLISLKQELKGHVVQEKGITLIDDEGIQIISRSFLRDEELIQYEENSKNREEHVNFTEEEVVDPHYNEVNSNLSSTQVLAPSLEEKKEKNEIETLSTENKYSDIVDKKDGEIKRSYEINALKSEINRLDTEIYKTNLMMQDYISQLEQKNKQLRKLLKERLS